MFRQRLRSVSIRGSTQGKISAVWADVNCMRDLLKRNVRWKYLINLSGYDFPLKTNREIVRQLKAYNGHNCIGNQALNDGPWSKRTKKRHRNPPPGNVTIHRGSNYFAGTRDFIDFVINDDLSRRFLAWVEDTVIPDETFIPTLGKLPRVPGYWPSMSGCRVKYQKWKSHSNNHHSRKCHGKFVHNLCIYQVGDLQELIKLPDLFVNKFHYNYDPVTMQCMEELLAHRILHEPEEYHLLYQRDDIP